MVTTRAKFHLVLFVLAGMAVLFFVGVGWADNPANPNYVLEEMKEIVDGYTPKLLRYARNLFIALSTLSLGVGMASMILSGESNLGSVAAHLVRWIVYVGFFMWVMGGQTFFIPHVVIESFVEAATTISGSQVMPGDVLEQGISIFGALMDAALALGWKEVIVSGLAGIVVIIVFALLAAVIAVTLIEMYVVVCGGSILIGFAGIDYTKDIAMSYLKYSVAVGVKLLVVMIIASVANDMTSRWAQSLSGIGDGEFFTVIGYLLGGSITLTLAAQMVPSIAQGMITGASMSTGGQLRGAGMAIAPLAAAGAGARSIGAGISNMRQSMRHHQEQNPGASGLSTLKSGGAYLRDATMFGSQSWQAAQHLGRKEGNYVDPPT